MRGLRGKLKGVQLTPHQYANDWIMADSPDREGIIVSPLSVQIEPADLPFFDQAAGNVGDFWRTFYIDQDTLRFARYAPINRRSR